MTKNRTKAGVIRIVEHVAGRGVGGNVAQAENKDFVSSDWRRCLLYAYGHPEEKCQQELPGARRSELGRNIPTRFRFRAEEIAAMQRNVFAVVPGKKWFWYGKVGRIYGWVRRRQERDG